MSMPVTVREIADHLGWEKDDAYHLVRVLLLTGGARERGIRRPEKGPGKGENVYSVNADASKHLAAIGRRLREIV